MSDMDDFFSLLTAPLELTAVKEPDPVLEEPVEDVVVADTPDGMFVQGNGQMGFVEEHITERQYATLTALEVLASTEHAVTHGQRFKLCGRHILAVESIVEPPHHWKALLDETVGFVPWPDILAADFFGPNEVPVVMVQPDLDISRTILSLYRHRYGDDAVVPA